MQKLVLRVIFNLLFEEWSAIWSQLARRNVRPAYLGYFFIFAFYFCILFSQASNMVKFIDKCSRVSGIYCAVFISYSLSNCLVMFFFFFWGGRNLPTFWWRSFSVIRILIWSISLVVSYFPVVYFPFWALLWVMDFVLTDYLLW